METEIVGGIQMLIRKLQNFGGNLFFLTWNVFLKEYFDSSAAELKFFDDISELDPCLH